MGLTTVDPAATGASTVRTCGGPAVTTRAQLAGSSDPAVRAWSKAITRTLLESLKTADTGSGALGGTKKRGLGELT